MSLNAVVLVGANERRRDESWKKPQEHAQVTERLTPNFIVD
jgi:hypothetical protein